jgi:hypothetical protein
MSPKPMDIRNLPGPPVDLIPGVRYLLVNPTDPEPVTFIGFSPYPPTVIVRDRLSRRFYCARHNLRCLPDRSSVDA